MLRILCRAQNVVYNVLSISGCELAGYSQKLWWGWGVFLLLRWKARRTVCKSPILRERRLVSNHSPFHADTSSAAKASPPDRIFLMREQDKTTSAWEKNTVRTKCTQEPKLGHAPSTKHTSSDINYYQVFFAGNLRAGAVKMGKRGGVTVHFVIQTHGSWQRWGNFSPPRWRLGDRINHAASPPPPSVYRTGLFSCLALPEQWRGLWVQCAPAVVMLYSVDEGSGRLICYKPHLCSKT